MASCAGSSLGGTVRLTSQFLGEIIEWEDPTVSPRLGWAFGAVHHGGIGVRERVPETPALHPNEIGRFDRPKLDRTAQSFHFHLRSPWFEPGVFLCRLANRWRRPPQ